MSASSRFGRGGSGGFLYLAHERPILELADCLVGSRDDLLAGLQAIPTMYYEAAEVDGASGWQRFRNITLPMVSPTLLYEDFSIRFAGIQQISAQSAVSQYAGYSHDWLKGREIATVYEQINLAYLSGFVDTATGSSLDHVVANEAAR